MAEMVASAKAIDPADHRASDFPEEELFRAQLYSLLSRLLAAPPDAALLRMLGGLTGDESELGQAFAALARVATATTPAGLEHDYHDLFIGLGRGELVPYGSHYLTGFLHEKPLAELRQALARLGISRAADVPEPEDHIAALCEVMAGLIDGAFGEPSPLAVQRALFERHIASWAPRFFADLEAANSSNFYRGVGRVGRLFLGIEATAFTMVTE
jgi:TorA maturation chaperone TorD